MILTAGGDVLAAMIKDADISEVVDDGAEFSGQNTPLIIQQHNGVIAIGGVGDKKAIVFDSEGNATFKGELRAKKIRAETIEGLEVLTKKFVFESQEQRVSTVAAGLSPSITPSPLPQLMSLEGLNVGGDATISSNLHVGGSSLIQGVLNVIDSITTGNLIVGKWADFMGSVIFRDAVTFYKRPVFSADSAGYAVIKKGASYVTVSFKGQYEDKPVVNVNMFLNEKENESPEEYAVREQRMNNGNYTYIISKQSTKGFTILLNKPAEEDVYFSWSAVTVREPALSEGADTGGQQAIPQFKEVSPITPSVTPAVVISTPIIQPVASNEAVLSPTPYLDN
jgi:hypothetical protein